MTSPRRTATKGGHVLDEVTFRVFGRPAPQGSKDGAGREGSIYLPAWRLAVKVEALRTLHDFYGRPALPVFVAGVPVHVTRCWFFVSTRPTDDPDIDKLLRSTLDALGGSRRSGARVLHDDAQIVSIDGLRIYHTSHPFAEAQPGALITMRVDEGL